MLKESEKKMTKTEEVFNLEELSGNHDKAASPSTLEDALNRIRSLTLNVAEERDSLAIQAAQLRATIRDVRATLDAAIQKADILDAAIQRDKDKATKAAVA